MNKKVKIIIGANNGDEGKGLATDYFCNQAKMVNNIFAKKTLGVLTNGTAQRGHTVDTLDKHHVFSHFSSGTFQGADTYISKYFAINPIIFIKEYFELANQYQIYPVVYVHPDCKVVTPFDMLANITQREQLDIHNTCGCGYWKTLERYNNQVSSLTIKEIKDLVDKSGLLFNSDFFPYLETIEEYHGMDLSKDIDVYNLKYNFKQDVWLMLKYIRIMDETIFHDATYSTIVFENGQGLLIGEQNPFTNWDYCTPSDTGIKYACDMCKSLFGAQIEVCYVSRTYLTRHGDGELIGECAVEDIGSHIIDSTNIFNDNQGRFRYGHLDTQSLLDRILSDFMYSNTDKINKYSLSVMFTHWNEKTISLTDFITEPRINYLYISSGKTNQSVVNAR